ncbi:hypothetical protein ACFUTR_25235 [Streptomyces sp. NPDC057367]|uniref:hypothetical protein n=1 Tax=Streptomyces sp. NPDC057367 TaxID=3346108 RepID=UPI0036356B5F
MAGDRRAASRFRGGRQGQFRPDHPVPCLALAEQRPGLVTTLALVNAGPGMDAFIAPDGPGLDPAR